jgi:homoserine dehydrogenase
MKIALIGFGTVGQGLAEILRDKADQLADYRFEIVAVATQRRGTLYHPDGLDIPDLLKSMELGGLSYYPDGMGLNRDWDVTTLIRQCNADVIVECTHTNLTNAQPALDYCRAALASGKNLVLANKGPIALAYAELKESARRAELLLRFEATVMAGTPSLRLAMSALEGCTITQARGILNGTTNYILTQMENGMDYAAALAEAQRLGYAEADPTADVGGWDAAGKALILSAALFDQKLTVEQMRVEGITTITVADVQVAAAAGERWRLIATVTPQGASVRPQRLPITHPLAGVSGATNAVTYSTDLLGDVTLVGAGAGKKQTGFGLLSDLLEIARLQFPY